MYKGNIWVIKDNIVQFYGRLYSTTHKVQTSSISYRTIYIVTYNEEYFKSLKADTKFLIIAHEVYHALLGHFFYNNSFGLDIEVNNILRQTYSYLDMSEFLSIATTLGKPLKSLSIDTTYKRWQLKHSLFRVAPYRNGWIICNYHFYNRLTTKVCVKILDALL